MAGLRAPRLGAAGWCGRSRRSRTARGAGDHAGPAGPGGVRRGRGGDRRARRRLAGRPVRVLRRDAVPDGGAAARAGDLVGRPPHRPHAARRRRRRRVLDADARRRGGRAGRLRRGAAVARRRSRRAARAPGPGAIVERARRWRGCRARRPRTSSATARGCTSTCASSGPRARRRVAEGERGAAARATVLARKVAAAELAAQRGRLRAHGDGAALARASAAGLERRRRDLDRLAVALAAHDPQRTLERGFALVEDAAGEPVVSPRPRASPALVVRLHDGRVPVRPEPPVG